MFLFLSILFSIFHRSPRLLTALPYRRGQDWFVGLAYSDGSEFHLPCGSKSAAENLAYSARKLYRRRFPPVDGESDTRNRLWLDGSVELAKR